MSSGGQQPAEYLHGTDALAYACPCGSLAIIQSAGSTFFGCISCGRRGLDSTSMLGALELWNLYVQRAYWRPRHVAARLAKGIP